MSDHVDNRLHALLQIYKLFDTWANDFMFACEKGCSDCCTRSVTMTTLEGELILGYIRKHPALLSLAEQLPGDSPAPAMTTNRFALACMRGEDIAEESQPRDFSPCMFLRNNCCLIYPVRSFMCRSFGSRNKCSDSGCAEVEPLYLTLTTVIMQCIEHLDRGRPWGNMNTVLRILTKTANNEEEDRVPRAEPLPGFLIPSDEEEGLRTRVHVLLEIVRER